MWKAAQPHILAGGDIWMRLSRHSIQDWVFWWESGVLSLCEEGALICCPEDLYHSHSLLLGLRP